MSEPTPTNQTSAVDSADPDRFLDEVASLLSREIRALLTSPDPALAQTPPWYALISAAQWPDTAPGGGIPALCEALDLDAEPLFLLTPEAVYHTVGPHLIALSSVPRHQLGVLVRFLGQAAASRALILFNSTLPETTLHDHLRGWMNGCVDGDDNNQVLLRYFDGRMGCELLQTLDQTVRDPFMQAFRNWHGWDWEYAPHHLGGPVRQRAAPLAAPLPIDESLLERLSAINSLHLLVVQSLEPETSLKPLPLAPALQHYVVRQQLKKGWAHLQKLGVGRQTHPARLLAWYALHRLPDAWNESGFCERFDARFSATGDPERVLSEGILANPEVIKPMALRQCCELSRNFLASLAQRIGP